MTPRYFTQRMTEICAGRDMATIKREGMKAICQALGENAAEYLLGLEVFMKRLEQDRPATRARQEAGIEL